MSVNKLEREMKIPKNQAVAILYPINIIITKDKIHQETLI